MENFFSMTLISFLNTAFSLVLYPLLIRRLGAESYGSFVFAFSFVNYFLALVAFGYDTVGAKYVAVADGNNDKRLAAGGAYPRAVARCRAFPLRSVP